MDLDRSPLARPFPVAPPVAGVTPRVARAGYKDWGRCDLTYIELAPGTTVAGVFTRNVCCSSEVELGREQVRLGTARALVVNAGNSNAFTGYRGREAVEQIMAAVNAGKPVFTEKPFTLTSQDAAKALRAAANSSARTWIGATGPDG